jgi:enamine deaminase RidA (YjgF/YER057c/UK114 family)
MGKQLLGTGHKWEKDFPSTLGGPAPWTQICKVRAGTLVFIAGQVAYDDLGRIIASDNMRAQAELAYKNVNDALESAGAKISDIVCERVYVPNMEDYMTKAAKVRAKFYADAGVETYPPMTLIGVNRLAHKDLMIEVEVIAALE